ncbi:MAG: RHS repeat-associated core domain-containing protein [Clostridia bacterium]|nr:RHS repeat-associated core domain-containing protein [Clostridia bacterium]
MKRAITDGAGNDVTNYPLHIANINPFRYKGYYFDSEIYLYYLNARYYDPVYSRFISADGYIASSGSFVGLNMFAYCENNPIMRRDPSGQFWEEIWDFAKEFGKGVAKAGAIVGAAAGAVGLVGLSLGGTIFSGGAAVGTIPAAVAVATELVGGAIAVVAAGEAVAVVGEIGENASYSKSNGGGDGYRGGSTYNKNGVRIDYENYGNGSGNVHAHIDGTKTKIYTKPGGMIEGLSKSISKIISRPVINNAIAKAIRYLEELS